MAEAYQQGVGALLTIQGQTPQFKRFYDELSPRLGHPSERENLHLTLVDSAETAVDVFSNRDLIALRRTQDEVGDYLSRLPLGEITLHPRESQIRKLSQRLCIYVEKTPFIEQVRNDLGKIVQEELDESLARRDFIPHISVLSLFRDSGRRPPKKPRSPSNLHVNGYLVGQQVFRPKNGANHSQSYVNHSRGALTKA